jgi:histidinol phosphatase-like PHP family hydrolase
MFGYKRAAAAILALDTALPRLIGADGTLPRIAGIGPASARVIREVLDTGASPTVERAVDESGTREDIEQRRAWRRHFLSRAAVRDALASPSHGVGVADYRADFQMHSAWSDGNATLAAIAEACAARGYTHAAVSDHSHGLRIAGGMTMEEAADQRRAVDDVNREWGERFRLLQGVEANIGADGQLDLSAEEASTFDLVLAAPHSRLRRSEDQTARLLAAVANPAVRILAHPRGRIANTRGGIVADWDAVFAEAARRCVAIEIDGDPARQDLDYTLAARALAAGCLFALDSDAHTTGQLAYAETAIAHARLGGVPASRIVNCWPLERLLAWVEDPQREAAAHVWGS